jgi:hypothetical protein
MGRAIVRQAGARRLRQDAARARDTVVTVAERARGVVRHAIAMNGVTQAAPPAELRRRVANLASGTYVSDILAEQDSTLYRWPERLRDAMRIYVEPSTAAPGFDPSYPNMARAVFDEWGEAGFPVRFAFVYDSLDADVRIRWRDRFPPTDGQRIGVTERTQTSAFQIAGADVTIALHDSSGRVLSPATVAGVVRHEVGHALGLNHANDPTSVMYHESATVTIAASDRATLRLLYLVPGGTLKD